MKRLKIRIKKGVYFYKNSFCKTKKGSYICNRIEKLMPDLLEKWQSGLLRQS